MKWIWYVARWLMPEQKNEGEHCHVDQMMAAIKKLSTKNSMLTLAYAHAHAHMHARKRAHEK